MPGDSANKKRPSAAVASEEPSVLPLPPPLVDMVLDYFTPQERAEWGPSSPPGKGGWEPFEVAVKDPRYWRPLVALHFPKHYPKSLLRSPDNLAAEYKRLTDEEHAKCKKSGHRALLIAVKNRDLSTVKHLIKTYANIQWLEQQEGGWEAFAWMYRLNQTEMLAHCYQVGTRGQDTHVSWSLAADLAQDGAIQTLLALEEDGIKTITPAMRKEAVYTAARNGYLEVVSVLLAGGAGVDHVSQYGDTALIWAASQGHAEIAEVLLAGGAGVDHEDNKGETALTWAASWGHTDIVSLLLAREAGVDRANWLGNTALIFAASWGHTEVVRVLLDKGAGVDRANRLGNTALIVAVLHGYLDIVSVLLAGGAGVDRANQLGNTALIVAADRGHAAIVRVLLEGGAAVDHVGNRGTALSWAAWKGHAEIVTVLLQQRIRVNHSNEGGDTALTLAARNGHDSIVRELIAHGANRFNTWTYIRLEVIFILCWVASVVCYFVFPLLPEIVGLALGSLALSGAIWVQRLCREPERIGPLLHPWRVGIGCLLFPLVLAVGLSVLGDGIMGRETLPSIIAHNMPLQPFVLLMVGVGVVFLAGLVWSRGGADSAELDVDEKLGDGERGDVPVHGAAAEPTAPRNSKATFAHRSFEGAPSSVAL